MHKYIIKRLLLLIPVILGVTFIVFFIMYLTPGDPAKIALGENAPQEQVDKMREEMGLNDHFLVQYARFVGKALTGDFGRSYDTKKPVFHEVFSRFPATLKLTIAGIIIAVLIGIPVGIISATKQYSIMDYSTMILALLGVSMPNFWLGLMLILFFSVRYGMLPSGGSGTLAHLILPAITLGTGVAGAILSTAGLAFIGLGVPKPQPDWGAMLADARNYMRNASHMATFPGLAIVITILALNLLGDGLRDALDPRLKQ